MRWTLFSRNSDSGFTLPELLVASLLGLIVTATLMSSTLTHRYVLKKDIVRTRINQNLRGSLDLIGADIRIGGENLNASFPVVELTSGSPGDTLTLRRALVPEILNVCATVNAASTSIVFGNTSGTAGCDITAQTNGYNTWRNHRISQGGTTRAFIYNTATRIGEFFDYVGEENTGTQLTLSRGATGWAATYTAGQATVLLLEEWQYRLINSDLQLIEQRQTASAKTMAFDITSFQAQVLMQDGSSRTSFVPTDPWTSIRAIEIVLQGQEAFSGGLVTKSLQGRFFPRNVFSN
jgi:prepilin-type N-terminal cleavage/methylation domain-containing protein